jgi:phosphoglycolate phosphatase-like HAD superfamily hydrolase
MIKNVIFDWSGVINDDLLTVYKTIMEIFKKFGGKEISLEEFKEEWEQPYMRFYNKYGIFTKLPREEEKAIYGATYNSVVSKYPSKPYPYIKDTLQKFKKAGVNMIVISSNLRETLLSDIEKFDLQEIFNEVNGDVHDKAEDIQETIQRNNFNPEETIFIGDTTHEVGAGKSAGTKTAAVTWGYNNEDKLRAANPDYIIHNLEELESILLK